MDYAKITEHLLSHDNPKSEQFKEGMARVLQNRVEDVPVTSPYSHGSVEDDAFFAGRMRAHHEFRNLLEEHGNKARAIKQLKAISARITA